MSAHGTRFSQCLSVPLAVLIAVTSIFSVLLSGAPGLARAEAEILDQRVEAENHVARTDAPRIGQTFTAGVSQ